MTKERLKFLPKRQNFAKSGHTDYDSRLTDDLQDVCLALLWFGVDLTFVDSGILDVGILTVQIPVDRVRSVRMNGTHPVAGIVKHFLP